jgi:hypothetical protein
MWDERDEYKHKFLPKAERKRIEKERELAKQAEESDSSDSSSSS